ncbi:hypothetical protein SacmaDRAFT_3147 [Saccharomonospora marina XMU15]|uniref:Uncharacterized protein n=1 Tax=Saccharomonospora marina XMU15 TaxID=882083 RepID=H5X8K7_9PSEU|nr:hypothetical protein [Saccharomonospora marina]EHR51376.1 hypothetical protein SacmaDRAFT_3147 [Saccharomonospora marina XMU15]
MTETLDPVTDDMDPKKLAEQLLAQADSSANDVATQDTWCPRGCLVSGHR